MNIQHRLEQIAERYREQGYQVTLNPGPDSLPDFAGDFKVELVARRGDGGVIASAKASTKQFEDDPDLPRYAEIIGKHPGWRYDVFVLAPPSPRPQRQGATDASEAEVLELIEDADRLYQVGFAPQGLLTAWAALESAMRHRLRAMGEEAEWGASPRAMLNELVSSGVLSHSEFRDLEGMSRLRNVIAHGFSLPKDQIPPGAISFLADTARRLLEESRPVESVP